MQPAEILVCARDPTRGSWLRALAASAHGTRVTAVPDEAALWSGPPRAGVAAIVVDRDRAPGRDDTALATVRAAHPAARVVLSVDWMSHDSLGAIRSLGVDACVPRAYTDDQRRLALELTLAGASHYPAESLVAVFRPAVSAAADAPAAPDEDYGLTPREKDVAVGIARASSNHEIALDLRLAPGVVRNHVSAILKKMSASSRTQAATLLIRRAWVRERMEAYARAGHGVLERMLAHVEHAHFRQGTVIFRKGEPGEHLYYILRGTIGLDEIDATMEPGEIFGDVGAFAPRHLRTCTARARTDVHLFRLDAEEVRRVFFESPEFAYHVVSVIAERVAGERGL